MTPVAALPMYDPPGLHGATDALWAGLAAAFRVEGLPSIPRVVDRDRPHRELWRDPALFLGQTCGYLLVGELRGLVKVVATPRYAAAGCAGASYTSRVVVRRASPVERLEELRGAACAANEMDSHSGMNGLRALVAPLARGDRFFGEVVWSGGHLASLELVVRGTADVAAVDCVTFALLERIRPDLTSAVRDIGRTAPCPGPPLVTAVTTDDRDVDRMRRALKAAAADPALAAVRAALLIDGFEVLPESAYGVVVDIERASARAGYPSLR